MSKLGDAICPSVNVSLRLTRDAYTTQAYNDLTRGFLSDDLRDHIKINLLIRVGRNNMPLFRSTLSARKLVK